MSGGPIPPKGPGVALGEQQFHKLLKEAHIAKTTDSIEEANKAGERIEAILERAARGEYDET